MISPSHNMFLFMARTAWQHAKENRNTMIAFYAMFIIANIALSLQPMALASIINAAQKGGTDAVHDALRGALAFGGLTLIFWSLHGPARVLERRTAFVAYRNFTTSLYTKVTEMPLRWHQDHHSGGVINRVNKAGKALFMFSQTQFIIIQTCVRFIASLSIMFYYSWWVALASITSSTIIICGIRFFDRRLIPLVRTTNEREHHINAGLYDYIGNIFTVLTLRMQGNTDTEIGHRYDQMKPSFMREIVVNEQKWAVVNMLLIFTQASITGIYVMHNMQTTAPLVMGSVVAIFQYLQNVNLQFFTGTLAYETLMYQHTDVHSVDGLLTDHAKLGSKRSAITTDAWDKLHIANLYFTHEEGEDTFHHLHNVNFTIKHAEKVALIGSSGSGKTTLLTLLRGLYDAQSVALTLDTQNFDSLAPLAGFTSLVPQDSEIFENTVRYNLTLGTDVNDATITQATHITTFDDVLPKLPHGVDTDIRERGVNLSGGQKQRLALARGLIAAQSSSLLLLDEPTSSVDLATEATIFSRLFSVYRDKTIVASIHRLHLLPRFDRIVVMGDGCVIEQGSFTNLLASNGALAHLWRDHLAHANQEAVTL